MAPVIGIVIGITFPDPATSAEVAASLEACDRAFLEGRCIQASQEASFELSGKIAWVSDTQARITIARTEDGASDSEEVSFVENDEPIERYRALGFTVGSLSSAFVAVPETPVADEPSPAPLESPQPEVRERVDPPDPLPDESTAAPSEPLDVALTRAALEAGFVGANGIANPRFGGELALWVPAYRRWVSRWSFSYTLQPETPEGVGASFWEGNALLGPRFTVKGAVLSALVGVQAQQIVVTLGEAELARPTIAVGPSLSLHARLQDHLLSPFLAARASYISSTPIRGDSIDQSGTPISGTEVRFGAHGPWQVQALAGVSLSFAP